jgi:hypothetical protein
VNEARTSSPTPTAVLTARPLTDERRAGSSRLATVKSAIWADRTNAYAQANRRPASPKASGTHSAQTRKAAIATKITIRTTPSSGSTTLVSHA